MFDMAGMLEEDLAGRLRRVDAHAVCQRSGVKGQARLGAASEARRAHHS